MKTKVIEDVKFKVRAAFFGDHTGHDWFHVERVWKNARLLAFMEGVPIDRDMLELTALLHDVGDHKFYPNEKDAYKRLIPEFLKEFNLDQTLVDTIIQNVGEISYKGKELATNTSNLEAALVQDADRLDAIGAIGIARAFAYGGANERSLYNPEEDPEEHESFESYANSKGHTINHFYEKLLLLKDRMQTESGRKLALERHEFMKVYLDQFYTEWNASK